MSYDTVTAAVHLAMSSSQARGQIGQLHRQHVHRQRMHDLVQRQTVCAHELPLRDVDEVRLE